jgi:UDP-N-acetylmuramyl pentapeptide phosphotransferase/UDP-N-acetylglucosamine-1-phosphate transferase
VAESLHHQVSNASAFYATIYGLNEHLVKLSVYLSSLLSLLIATILGFLDDVFDIRWRHKLPIPIIASIPLFMVYYAERGNTHVVVPLPLRPILGTLLNLGESVNYNISIIF